MNAPRRERFLVACGNLNDACYRRSTSARHRPLTRRLLSPKNFSQWLTSPASAGEVIDLINPASSPYPQSNLPYGDPKHMRRILATVFATIVLFSAVWLAGMPGRAETDDVLTIDHYVAAKSTV